MKCPHYIQYNWHKQVWGYTQLALGRPATQLVKQKTVRVPEGTLVAVIIQHAGASLCVLEGKALVNLVGTFDNLLLLPRPLASFTQSPGVLPASLAAPLPPLQICPSLLSH